MSPAKRLPIPALPINVWAVTATSFLTDISSEMIFNLLPLFLANVLGASTSVIGLIEGIAETTASLLKAASGWLSDKLRQRKWLTVAGYALSAVSKPFLYGATTWGAVLGVRFADRVGKGIRTAPRDALIADSIDERRRGLAFGFHRAGDTAGAFIGLLIALVVVLATQADAVRLDRDAFQTLVLISIIPAVLAVIVLAVVAKDVPVRHKTRTARLGFRDLNPRFRLFLGIIVVFTLGNSADAFLVLRAQERGLSVAGVLGMLLTFNLVYAVLAGPAGALSDKAGRGRLIIGGWLAYGLIYLGFALSRTAWHIWGLYALYGCYYATVEGTAKALVADLVLTEQRGTAYGYYNAVVGLMAFPASLLAGVLWQQFGASTPFLAGSLLALAAAALMALWYRTGQVAPLPV
jgi:MFS family permease